MSESERLVNISGDGDHEDSVSWSQSKAETGQQPQVSEARGWMHSPSRSQRAPCGAGLVIYLSLSLPPVCLTTSVFLS